MAKEKTKKEKAPKKEKIKSTRIQVSASKLKELVACPRCFWLMKNATTQGGKTFKHPTGAFPSLPAGVDKVIKKYFDHYRANRTVPPEFKGAFPGRLFEDQAKLDLYRNWRTGLKYVDEALDIELVSAFDDLLINDQVKAYIPLDYKTKSGEPKTDGSEYYQVQLDCYELCLQANGYDTCGKGILAYMFPEDLDCSESNEFRRVIPFNFGIKVIELPTYPENARKFVEQAAEVLKGPMPDPHPDCAYCNYTTDYLFAVQKHGSI